MTRRLPSVILSSPSLPQDRGGRAGTGGQFSDEALVAQVPIRSRPPGPAAHTANDECSPAPTSLRDDTDRVRMRGGQTPANTHPTSSLNAGSATGEDEG